jgi:phage terminase large subunit-like protein
MAKKLVYPTFCTTDQDRDTYRVAIKGKYQQYVTTPNDLVAIRMGCWFDHEAAERIIKFAGICRQTAGEWAGKPLVLQDWQKTMFRSIFGWKRSDATRRYRKCGIWLGKGNGKSTLCSLISLYLLVADGEEGAQIYNSAVDRSQVENVMGPAKAMVQQSPLLAGRLEILNGRHRINYLAKRSFYQALSADAGTADGKDIHGGIIDELHRHKNRQLFDVLQSGGRSRRQPLLIIISTAGDSATHFSYAEYRKAKGVLEGTNSDWSYFGFVAEAHPNDDPGDPETWAKANPGLGISPKLENLQDYWREAQGNPEDERRFKQLHLGIWTQAVRSAIPLEVWDRGGDEFDPEELVGCPCVAGLDLGSVSDLTCLVLLFAQDDGTYRVILYCWCPEDRSLDRDKGKVSYLQWMQDGFMIPTEGDTMDYERVRSDICKIALKYQINSLAVDALFQGGQLMTELSNYDGLPVVKYANNMMSMAEPTRTFYELVLSGKLRHGGNPVLRWMASNLVFKRDTQGNYMPDKQKAQSHGQKSQSHGKIDGISAMCMALGVRSKLTDNTAAYYETHALVTLG